MSSTVCPGAGFSTWPHTMDGRFWGNTMLGNMSDSEGAWYSASVILIPTPLHTTTQSTHYWFIFHGCYKHTHTHAHTHTHTHTHTNTHTNTQQEEQFKTIHKSMMLFQSSKNFPEQWWVTTYSQVYNLRFSSNLFE